MPDVALAVACVLQEGGPVQAIGARRVLKGARGGPEVSAWGAAPSCQPGLFMNETG